MEDVVMLEKKRVPDGEGGFTTDWAEGVQFKAAISFDSSMEARTAEKQGVTSLYTVTVPLNAKLEYHDVIRRLRDGKVFRIKSDGDDVQTPKSATFQFLQVEAEEWELPV
ncbi:MAG: head-tail adaptor protein [Bacteroidaceae bacterium]|nr:head-tail adaptor protein [Bacteroidaceae bacterium]